MSDCSLLTYIMPQHSCARDCNLCEEGKKRMDGAIVLKAALEALAGAGVKTAIGLAKSIWDWIEDRVKKSPGR